MRTPNIAFVVPCYNEEPVLNETARRLAQKTAALCAENIISQNTRVFFVDDGSTDGTWSLIKKLHSGNPALFDGVKLTRNCGHQNALLAGLLTAKASFDAVISMDADLQDDINAVDGMIRQFREGCHIVYGVRSARKTDTFFKKITAQGFYKTLEFLGADIVYNHADFRLMSRQALASLAEFGEVNLFLRGLVPMLGYKTGIEYYERMERFAGESKYPLGKMLKFAFEGITSLSIKPIRMITWMGVLIFSVSLALIGVFIYQYFMSGTVPGWASTIVSLWGIGGLILFSIGIIGEYIGKIYLETKHRPRFQIENVLGTE
jgi:glycosyltransferase involved in cell wall biosynthesis